MSDKSANPTLCICYFSQSGTSAALAKAIADGARDVAQVTLISTRDMTAADWDLLDGADAIVFGAPTYMGSTPAQYNLFLEEAGSRWDSQLWIDKLAAGFTTALHSGGDKLGALSRLSIFAAQMGMIWVGQSEIGAPVRPENDGINRDGYWLGLATSATGNREQPLTEGDRETAQRFGRRIATAARRWTGRG